VERRNYLGIHLNTDKASVVCLGIRGRERELLGCFSVVIEDKERQNPQTLISLIAQGCAERNLRFLEVAVALDCSLFMHHSVHSEFNDPQKIAATVRFDTEEALTTDVSDDALAFMINSSGQDGSKLTVFTAQRKTLTDILVSLQDSGMDPTTMEPDVHCLARFVSHNVSLEESAHDGAFLAIFSSDRGYFVVSSGSQKVLMLRTFLVGPKQDRTELLSREVLTTMALAAPGERVGRVFVFESAGSTDYHKLEEKLGVTTETVDLTGSAGVETETLSDCVDPVDFAIAYGAALAHSEKSRSINFRNDFMPFQGKKLRLQRILKFVSISVTILLMVIGLYFQTQLLKMNKIRSRLRNQLSRDYSTVMLNQKLPDKVSPVGKLGNELRRVRDVKSGLISSIGEKSISSKLTLVLEAFNKCAAQTGLNIDSITITAKTISIDGDTSSRQSTLQLFEAMKGRFSILPRHLESKGGRDSFSIALELQ
jgi:hypothetical protein